MNRRKFFIAVVGASVALLAAKPALAEDKSYAAALAKAFEKGKKNGTSRSGSIGIRG
jgi:hypothetical protein